MRILKEFIRDFKRFRTAGLLNILGLTVASAVFMAILFHICFENGYDKFRRDADRIFRVEMKIGNDGFSSNVPYPVCELLAEGCPSIEQSFVQRDGSNQDVAIEDEQGAINKFNIPISTANLSMCDVIDFQILYGEARKALAEPGMILLPESQATRLFGSAEEALNRRMKISGGSWNTIEGDYTVAGIYKDFPGNSIFSNNCYAKLNEQEMNWGNWNVQFFIKSNLKDPIALTKQLNDLKIADDVSENGKLEKRVTPLTDIYFHSKASYETKPTGNLTTSRILFGVSILIILIATINFINFSMSLAPARIKGVNTHKVLGAGVGKLRLQLMCEAMIYATIAFTLSLFLLQLADHSFIGHLFATSISPQAHPLTTLGCGGMILIVGLSAGFFPARYITSFAPALVLKGNFVLSPQGQRIRNGLMTFQFVISVALITCMLLMNNQQRYMQNYTLGFHKDQIVYFQFNQQLFDQRHAFTNELMQSPDITDYAYTDWIPESDNAATISGSWNENNFQFDRWFVDRRFMQLMGIPLISGHEFSKNREETEVIFTETALKQMPFLEKYMGQPVETAGISGGARFVGVAKDVQHLSLRQGITPLEFVCINDPQYHFDYMLLKISPNTGDAMKYISQVFNRFSKYNNLNVRFLDDTMQQRYEKESRLTQAISLFGLIAIIISLIGVYGMIVYNAQYKRKEIALRKVNGATEKEILVLLNRGFFLLLGSSFLIACPLAYYIISSWLSRFAYKAPVYWWLFVLSGAIVFSISLLTISWQSWRAATTNPVEGLKES
ncbi:ABC transporter permease [Culturomica massiliensis]|uniref:ABC transporter permease n=1 Tax=Culturomica massiliensis TaxID=1841857 RepID=UPI00266642DB|nr:ABC transporter permease [Culturomica massiliensis]